MLFCLTAAAAHSTKPFNGLQHSGDLTGILNESLGRRSSGRQVACYNNLIKELLARNPASYTCSVMFFMGLLVNRPTATTFLQFTLFAKTFNLLLYQESLSFLQRTLAQFLFGTVLLCISSSVTIYSKSWVGFFFFDDIPQRYFQRTQYKFKA